MVTNGTELAHQLWTEGGQQPGDLGVLLPVGVAGGAYRGDDLTADFMTLAGSHMATTKVLARLVRASRSALMWTRGDNFGDLLAAIEAAEKDLGL